MTERVDKLLEMIENADEETAKKMYKAIVERMLNGRKEMEEFNKD